MNGIKNISSVELRKLMARAIACGADTTAHRIQKELGLRASIEVRREKEAAA